MLFLHVVGIWTADVAPCALVADAEAFEQAIELGHDAGVATYNIACCEALMGDADGAMRALEKAFDAGFDDELYDIWVVNSDGSDPKNLTNGRFNNQSPYWAMEHVILFTSDRGGDWDIYSMSPEGRDLKQLTNTSRIDETTPSWPQAASLSVTTVGKLATTWGNIKSR